MLAVQWPAGLPQARVIEELAAHVDLYPTLLELCGVEAPPGPPIDGVSLAPLLEGRAEGWPDRRWGTLAVGRLPLEAGRQSLVIEAVRTAGDEVLELKHVRLRRVE